MAPTLYGQVAMSADVYHCFIGCLSLTIAHFSKDELSAAPFLLDDLHSNWRPQYGLDFSDFERDVRTLLQLQGWRVQTERLLGDKTIDAYAENVDSFGHCNASR